LLTFGIEFICGGCEAVAKTSLTVSLHTLPAHSHSFFSPPRLNLFLFKHSVYPAKTLCLPEQQTPQRFFGKLPPNGRLPPAL
jgi:hypothetical protein